MLFQLKEWISYWLMPMPLCIGAVIAGTVLLRMQRARRLGRTLLVSGVVLWIAFSTRIVSYALIRPLEIRYAAIPEFAPGTALPRELAACHYVAVLGAGHGYDPALSANNQLVPSAVNRLTEGIRILRLLPNAMLIVSGPGNRRHPERPTNAAVVAQAARALGVPAERIKLIDQALDTEDESREIRKITHDAPVALVTSAVHMQRAMALCRSAEVRAVACPSEFRTRPFERFTLSELLWDPASLERSTYAMHEYIGYVWIWLRGRTA